MQRRSLIISVVLHVTLVLALTVSMPFLKRDFEVPQPISVELLPLDKLTQTDKPAETKPVKKAEEDKPEPQKSAVAQNTSDTPLAPPKPEPKKDKKPEPKKEEKEKIDPKAQPDKKKKKKEDKPKDEEPEPKKDFSSVLKNLAESRNSPADTSPDAKAKDSGSNKVQAPLGQRMTMSEMDALRQQLENCWNIPIGAKEAQDLNIEIFMSINTDRTLREARVIDMLRYNSDGFFRAAADSALRAVRSPFCSPFDLPPDKYDQWKEMTVNFNPREMF
jgi:outer membrane biosynthesis protein TonB